MHTLLMYTLLLVLLYTLLVASHAEGYLTDYSVTPGDGAPLDVPSAAGSTGRRRIGECKLLLR
jgi:hypothetical protein